MISYDLPACSTPKGGIKGQAQLSNSDISINTVI